MAPPNERMKGPSPFPLRGEEYGQLMSWLVRLWTADLLGTQLRSKCTLWRTVF